MDKVLEKVLEFIDGDLERLGKIKARVPEEIGEDDFFDGEDTYIDGRNEGQYISLLKVKRLIHELNAISNI